MTKQILTDAIIRDLPAPKKGMTIVRDIKVPGLGVRILPPSRRDPEGTRAFILDYHSAGRRRVFTLGKFPQWKLTAAREKAKELQARIRHQGLDPAEQLKDAREALTVAELVDAFKKNHVSKLRPSTCKDYGRMLKNDVLPALGKRKVASIHFKDIEALHHKVTSRGAPKSANYVVAVCSKLFSYAKKLREIAENPAQGVKRNPAEPRDRYLTKEEISKLTDALADYHDQDAADLFRLLLLTGARRGETQSATWDQINFTEAKWTKPASSTKSNRTHHLPLAAAARALLAKRRVKADAILKTLEAAIVTADHRELQDLEEWKRRVETFLFPSREGKAGHVTEAKKSWATILKNAGIVRREIIKNADGSSRIVLKPDARMHDLRHTSASILASSGASLPLIGSLLGHSQPATTARYSHLTDDALKGAVEQLGASVMGTEISAEIVKFHRTKHESSR